MKYDTLGPLSKNFSRRIKMVSKSTGSICNTFTDIRHEDDTNGVPPITSFFGEGGKTASPGWYGKNVFASEF
jgi:hypothetical protein